MSKLSKVMFGLACAAVFSLSYIDDAEARRFGGGRSFGTSSGITRSAPLTRQANPGTSQQQGSSFQRQQNTGAGAATAARSTGRGGMLGGLLAGTLLGSLLFGGVFAGFGGMDLILLGLVIYVAYRIFRRRPGNQASSGQAGQGSYQARSSYTPSNSGSAADSSAWDRLRSNNAGGQGQSFQFQATEDSAQPAGAAGAASRDSSGFDVDDFMRGAKMLYVRMQDSWDHRDLQDIAEFATAEVLQVVQEDMAADPQSSQTELVLINGEFLGREEKSGLELAAVLFDVLLREDPSEAEPKQVREIWTFSRPLGSRESWKLAGIQQN